MQVLSHSASLKPQDIISFCFGLYLTRCFVIIGCALVWWDWLITLEGEVRHIWPTRWSFVKIVFLTNRYLNLLAQPLICSHILGLIPSPSTKMCQYIVTVYSMFTLVSLAFIHVLVVYRTWVIWNGKTWAAFILFVLYGYYTVSCFAIMIYALAKSGDRYILRVQGTCVPLIYSSTLWSLWVASLALEYGCFTLTIASLLHHRRKTAGLARSYFTVRQRIYNAAFIYGPSMTLLHVFNMIAWSKYRKSSLNLLATTFSFSLANVAGQRLVLDLRSRNVERMPSSQQMTTPTLDIQIPTIVSADP